MPYTDPEKRRTQNKRWRKQAMAQGYGKALYARRAARYRNEEILREALQDIRSTIRSSRDPDLAWVEDRCMKALRAAPPVGPPSDYMP